MQFGVFGDARSQVTCSCKHVQCETPEVIHVEVLSRQGEAGLERGIWEPTVCRWYLKPGGCRGLLRREASYRREEDIRLSSGPPVESVWGGGEEPAKETEEESQEKSLR